MVLIEAAVEQYVLNLEHGKSSLSLKPCYPKVHCHCAYEGVSLVEASGTSEPGESLRVRSSTLAHLSEDGAAGALPSTFLRLLLFFVIHGRRNVSQQTQELP